MNTWLLKPAELTLKGGNRKTFENKLKQNLLQMLSSGGIDGKAKVRMTEGRYYLECHEEKADIAENILSRLPGISGWAKTVICNKTVNDVMAACIEEGKKIALAGGKTFKIEGRRTDKSFPLDSYKLCCLAGENVLNAASGLKVDVHNPEKIIYVEIREKAYVYSDVKKGLGGLPAGSAGKGLLLLSGGIDSPVAGFLMAKRGLNIDTVHFHSYPYTSQEAKEKAIHLAKIVGSYCTGSRFYILNFTKVQQQIKKCTGNSHEPWITILLRMAMMEAAEEIANKTNSKCLITGESLSQVASQTIENLSCTQSRIKLPVFRPLIGFCKEDIIKEAQFIGSYQISIQPYADCCTLFTPAHPVLYGDPAQACALYETLELEPSIEEALANAEQITKNG